MSSTAKIQHKDQVTIPTHVREQVGLSKGDPVEFSYQRGRIVITPKVVIDRSQLPAADDEYTPAQRRAVNHSINQSLKEYRHGKVSGPFNTAKELNTDLYNASAKLNSRKKTKRAAK